MGSVIPLKKSANSAYLELKNLLGYKLQKVESLIEQKLKSDVDLIKKMSDHHLKSGGKRLRALLTLESAKLTGYKEDNRDINLAACVELIHSATLLHDDVIDESSLRRGGSQRLCLLVFEHSYYLFLLQEFPPQARKLFRSLQILWELILSDRMDHHSWN